ncbi:TldD protein [Lachnospiraceae bacterium XBB1006]|nr:TldD protein [Lachnospiraceae bacterium XBB1006]
MFNDVIKEKKSLFDTSVQTVLRQQQNRERRVILMNGNLVTNVRTESSGICGNVYQNGVRGFSSIAECSGEAAEKVLKAATENAALLNGHLDTPKAAYSKTSQGIAIPNRLIEDATQKQIIELCKKVDSYVAEHYKDLVSRLIMYREDSMEKYIYTSDANDGHVSYPRCMLYIGMTKTTKEGQPVEVFGSISVSAGLEKAFSNFEIIRKEIEKTYKQVSDKAEGTYADAGYKTVILHPDVAGMIAHEAVGHTVEADLVRGGSVAGPNLNKQVASELVNIVDFAHTAFGKDIGIPVYLDDEGIVAKDAVLIENGILKSYMHNRESADFYGVEPTGNARGWAFSDEPIIRMRNTMVLPGKDKLEDMIASVENGYYLTSTGNGQADLTGEFMFGINMGYEIKNGKLGKAILDTTVSGVAFDMLKTVDMVSDELVVNAAGTCGKKQPMSVSMGGPAIRCKLMIGGR